MTQRQILLIDGSSLMYRAFYSILDLTRFKNSSGLHTNALFSFKRMLDNVLEEFEPTHVLVAFDKSNITFRTKKYEDYKAGRQKTPPELKEQMPYFRVLLDAYGLKHYELLDYEADDIIGTLAKQADENDSVAVLSGDKDLIQLADDRTTVYITRRGVSQLEAYTPETLADELDLTPDQYIDLMGLMGDPSDNIPGVTRIGEKTALKLLHQFGSMDELYARLDELNPTKMKENLINEKDIAYMSRDLATIKTDSPIEIDLEDIKRHDRDTDALLTFYQEMNFNQFLSDLQSELGPEAVEDSSEQLPDYEVTVLTADQIEADHLPDSGAILLEALAEDAQFGEVEALAWGDLESQQIYVMLDDEWSKSQLFVDWLEDETTSKTSYDWKTSAVLANNYEVDLAGFDFDVKVGAYLADPQRKLTIPSILDFVQLPAFVQEDEVVYGKGARRKVPEDEQFVNHLANKVKAILHVRQPLEDLIDELEMTELLTEVELPLVEVLTQMELTGIRVDHEVLDQMNQSLLEDLSNIESQIYELAGEEFNLNSPQQLSTVLFEQLELTPIRKTKTGYSTAADVLEKLVDEHPIIPLILDYRQLAKLQGTYLAGLPKYIKEDGKIHTTFEQTLTQTGRLSSSDPNLQNIPIRIEQGRKVRQAFVPSQPGWQLFGADYSQIELRVLASISEDQHMIQAFQDGEDIHAATARRVFGLDAEQEVDGNERRQAKAVNFGIVYGISDYGLSQNLNIPRKQAKDFIDRYLTEYSGVKRYMTRIVEEAKRDGYVSTLFHRRRYLPDIHSSNYNIRSFAERTAMNSPIQGTAADIIKIAMVRLDQRLKEEGLQARLLLQVHDELILEAPEDEIERLEELVPEVMEHAAQLAVPLKVDPEQGTNWYEL